MGEERHTLGTAYVQIMPSAEGIGGSIHKVLGGEADSAGVSVGNTIVGKIKTVIATAAIGETLRQSIMQGAALEQSLGGIETLFKEHADVVIENAKHAYKTAGLSANEYMENATSFAASLLQSVGGNTEEAARLTDMALIDMSDNANKMGSSMEMITNAYQGFAKQNYTMLDNLKLGYGGTKTEMERLLADATKLSGVEYDIENLSDVYSAIHVIQEELNITGTTSVEASETIMGSFSAMKAAAQDFMANIVLGEDVGPAMVALAETAGVFFFNNLMPAIGNIIMSLPEVVYALIKEGGPKFIESGLQLISNIEKGLSDGIPKVLEKGKSATNEFVNGLLNRLPSVTTATGKVVSKIVDFIKANLPQILFCGGEILVYIASGILKNLPQLTVALGKLAGDILKALVDLIPVVLTAGTNVVAGIANGITNGITSKLSSAMGKVKTALTAPIEQAKESIRTIIDKIKSLFDITLSFKGIRLPHIDMSWKTSGVIAEAAKLLGIPGVPQFSVNWYKTGGIFDEPSIIGVGEAGAEAVVPLDKLWSKLDDFIGQRVNVQNSLTENEIKNIITESINAIESQLVNAMSNITLEVITNLDGRTVARVLTPFIDASLGRRAVLAERG